MQDNSNTYLKRGEGKIKGDVKKASFFLFYIKNAKETLLSQNVYKAFLKELLETYSTEVVTTGLELRINKVGKFRIKSSKLKFFDKNGVKYKSLRPNWKSTWEMWHKKYPELNRDQIAALTNKAVIYHENEHSDQEFYEHYWDKTTINLKFKSFYTFKASRQYSRLIAKIVKDPNRKVFYYG
jgi:hypothetical protein